MSDLSPLNALFRTVYFEEPGDDFVPVPVTAGTVTAFLATSSEPDATAVDPTLSVSATHVGVSNPTAEQYPLGTWGIVFPADVLTVALLDSFFGPSGTAYLIVVRDGGVRVFARIKYVRARAADTV